MLDSLSGKCQDPLGALDPFCTLHFACALMVTLSDQDLIISSGQVITRLYAIIEHVALRYKIDINITISITYSSSEKVQWVSK
jgi:hypothetical protein